MRPKSVLRLIFIAVCASVLACANSQPVQTPQPPPKPLRTESVLADNTIFAVYGRAFNVAPILGRLGAYGDFGDMEKDVKPWVRGIGERHDKKNVIPAIHLIYGMATTCTPKNDCLLYLEGRVKDLAGEYIEPAAKREWMVILDTQIGRSSPVPQVRRIIDKGYLKYENVAVALDPEFHLRPGRTRPGIPIGTIKAAQINEVQQMLDDYVREQRLQKKKVLIVHQFGDPNVDDGVPFMIENKKELKTYENVELVIDMDGLGKQAVKVIKYNKITDSKIYPFIKFRAIKVFFPNRWEKHGHFDRPPLSLDQIFGIKPAASGQKMQAKPDVLIIA